MFVIIGVEAKSAVLRSKPSRQSGYGVGLRNEVIQGQSPPDFSVTTFEGPLSEGDLVLGPIWCILRFRSSVCLVPARNREFAKNLQEKAFKRKSGIHIFFRFFSPSEIVRDLVMFAVKLDRDDIERQNKVR